MHKEEYINKIYQDLIYKRSYSRWIEEEKRRETWDETINRYFDYFLNRIPKQNQKEYKDISKYVKDKVVMPSMRCLWTAGEALDRDNISGYNCSYLPINKIKSFSEMLYILMNGTGVGFSVEKRYNSELPIIPIDISEVEDEIVVSDSKKGWASGYFKYMKELYNGRICKYDLSKLRAEGERLKTFGGKASGPEPLRQLFEFTKAMFIKNKGKRLSSIDCYDICCYIANTVVAGGVRRSACVSLSDITDNDMRYAKTGEFINQNKYRGLTNNSAVYEEKPDVITFLKEWKSIIQSRSGERGIFNRESAKFLATQTGRRKNTYSFGGNPCQPEWATVLTPAGIRQFKNIAIGDEIWSEDGWVKVINKVGTGIKDVYRYRTNSGVFYGTKEHSIISSGEKIEVDKAESIDVISGESTGEITHNPKIVMDGIVLGDGSVHKASNNLVHLFIGEGDKDYFNSEISSLILKHRPGLHDTAYEIATNITHFELPKTYKRSIPDRYKYGDSTIVASFLRGLFTANGCALEKARRIQLSSSSEQLVEDVQIMLSSIGIRSYITSNKEADVEFKNGMYTCKKSWIINITSDIDIFNNKVGFLQIYKNNILELILTLKGNKRPKKTYDISSKDFISTEEVYDITVDGEHHTYWTGGCNVSNCLEIILRPYEFCNLTECIVREEDKKDDLLLKVRYATILGCIQATLTKFVFINREWKKNAEEERLLGVSLSGLRDHPILGTVNRKAKLWLTEMRQVAIDTAEEWSNILNINMPVAITCVKPSGCQTKDTIIITSKGFEELDEILENKDNTWTDIERSVIQYGYYYTYATKFYNNGFGNTLKIKMKSGNEFECTLNHKYQIFKENKLRWIEAEDLKIGDNIPYVVKNYAPKNNILLKNINYDNLYHNTKRIKTPKYITPDFAWVLGLYTSDGSNHDKGIRIAGDVKKIDILIKAKNIIEEQFGIKGIIYERSKGNNADLFINSKAFLEWLKINNLLKNKSKDIFIPYSIRCSNKSIISSFIDGYWSADGCINHIGRTYCTISKRMAKQMLIVLRAIGIDSSIREMPPTKSSWGNNMRYWIQEKKGRSGNYLMDRDRKDDYTLLDKAGYKDLYPDYIISIEASNNFTYDIEVPKNNMYLANSSISHNTVSQLVDCSSGLHARYSQYYIRRIRISKTDAISDFLISKGVKYNPEIGYDVENANTLVFDFPLKAKESSILVDEISALDQLEYWLMLQKYWCEHKPSVTIYVKDNEWLEVGNWVYNNWNYVSGISFLPVSNDIYKLSPYEEIDEEEYSNLIESFPEDINFDDLINYENVDNTEGAKEYACVGGACEV